MNVTELARVLKITPQELRDYFPRMGFDIGQRAIKVDKQTAKKIINAWPLFSKRLAREVRAKQAEEKELEALSGEKKEIEIPNLISVKQFSDISGVGVNKILGELMKNGIFTSLNEKIDFDTATVIGADLGLEIKPAIEEEESLDTDDRLKEVLEKQDKKDLKLRPPVTVVMGHVDHGKTMLLDSIRKTNIISGEAGGITQHIGAYQVTRKNKVLSFIDTPGHEAFTAMRNRGAKVADIAILVVAADDGVKPQTVEAFRIIEAAGLPFVVAINKMDKEDANADKVKQELASKLNITPEDWGGKTVCVPISAKNGDGIDELLDILLITAEMEEDNLQANPDADAIGTIIESNIDKGEGNIATILIQNGTLRIGDNLVCNNILYGKVRNLKNYKGETVKEAGPSTPVKIIGFRTAPSVGDIVEVADNGIKTKFKKIKSNNFSSEQTQTTEEADDGKGEKINIIIKSDTLGSGEAIEGSLSKIDTQGVKIKFIHKGLGNITEGDVIKAESSNAFLVGFSVNIPYKVAQLARDKKVELKSYKIIYELIDDIKEKVQELVKPEIKRIDLGRLKVLGIFRTESKLQIVGGRVLDGQIKRDSLVEVVRKGEIIDEGKMTKMQMGKEEVNIAEDGNECGITYEGKPIIEEGDILNVYQEEKIYKKVN